MCVLADSPPVKRRKSDSESKSDDLPNPPQEGKEAVEKEAVTKSVDQQNDSGSTTEASSSDNLPEKRDSDESNRDDPECEIKSIFLMELERILETIFLYLNKEIESNVVAVESTDAPKQPAAPSPPAQDPPPSVIAVQAAGPGTTPPIILDKP